MSDTDLNTLFQQAVDGYAKAFLDAESAIYAQGDTAATFLATKAADQTQPPFVRFVAATLADGVKGTTKVYQSAMGRLDDRMKNLSRTPVAHPRPESVAALFSAHGETLTDMVALHLVKEVQWPNWLSLAAIIHLGHYAGPSVLPAFDQFKQDLDAGKRPLGRTLEQSPGSPLANLAEAMNAVRVVIEADAKKDKRKE